MDHSIVILHGEDIAAAQQVAAGLPGCEACVFDPVLVDRARAAGFERVRFVPWTGAPDYALLHEQSHAAASALERELDRLVASVIAEASIDAWQHLNLYYLFMALGWYTGLAAAVIGQFAGRKLHVLLCDNPAIYYFNAFVPGLLMLQHAQAQGIESAAYTYEGKPDPGHRLPQLAGRATARTEEVMLAHLPTCMYDIHYFNDEFRASGKAVINIEARYFGMPVAAAESIPLVAPEQMAAAIAPAWQAAVERVEALLVAHLEAFFADKIPAPAFRARQVAQIAGHYRAQLLTLHLLERYFELDRPAKLLLSDHDTGWHGPLLAFAERHHLPVLLLPHSKTTPDIEFGYRNMVALTHPIQGSDILDRAGRQIRHHALALPTTFAATTAFPAPIRRVALMLNALTLSGIHFAPYRPYLEGIRQIADWCQAQGVALDIRCKPSYSIVHLLATELGLDPQGLAENAAVPMAEFAARCDLCLMYDTPTAGAMEFLNQGIAILNPLVTSPTRAQAVTTHPDVVPRESIAQTLQRLQAFVADPVAFHQFRLRQFQRYVALFANARPLRSFL